jgi:hypothetical protein
MLLNTPLASLSDSWSLSTRYGWRKVQPPVEYLIAKAAKDEEDIRRRQKVRNDAKGTDWSTRKNDSSNVHRQNVSGVLAIAALQRRRRFNCHSAHLTLPRGGWRTTYSRP